MSKGSRLGKVLFPILMIPLITSITKANDLENFVQQEKASVKFELQTPTKKNFLQNIRFYFSGPSGSYHYNREADTNEENWIWGIGIPFSNVEKYGFREIEGFVFRCRNSEDHPSTAIGTNLKFWCSDTPLNICAGIGIGGRDGYKIDNHQFKLSKYPFPNISLSYRNLRFNAYVSNVVTMYTFGINVPLGKK